jgi:plasmid stabilization system protein ParE
MAKTVRISRRAARDIEKITDYLFEKWDSKVVDNFVKRYEECFDLLANNPGLYPIARSDKQIRRCVLTKHNVVYFREFPNKITILTIFDTRQNPKKLNKII